VTHSDELVERGQTPSPWPAKVQLGAHVFQNSYDDGSYYCYELRASIKFADPAALSALPSHELLREALEALTPFCGFGDDSAFIRGIDEGPPPDHVSLDGFFSPRNVLPFPTFGDLRRARATAEKLRAELGVG